MSNANWRRTAVHPDDDVIASPRGQLERIFYSLVLVATRALFVRAFRGQTRLGFGWPGPCHGPCLTRRFVFPNGIQKLFGMGIVLEMISNRLQKVINDKRQCFKRSRVNTVKHVHVTHRNTNLV